MAVCVAVVNRNNSPKYIACVNPAMELDFHYKVHTSLDVIEERLSNKTKSNTESREFYLGECITIMQKTMVNTTYLTLITILFFYYKYNNKYCYSRTLFMKKIIYPGFLLKEGTQR